MDKNYWDIYFNAVKTQDWAQAKNALEHLKNTERNNPQVYLKLGDVHQRTGDSSSAISAYHKAAWILKKTGFIQKALALYKIILRLDSFNEEALKLSKELMIELQEIKVPRQETHLPYAKFVEPSEQQSEPEKGLPLGLEEAEHEAVKQEELVSPPQQIEDLIERTSYSRETIEIKQPSELQQKEEVGIEKQPQLTEISVDRKIETCLNIPPLFSTVPAHEISSIFNKITPQKYSQGETILEEGDSGDSIFIIKSGHARVVAHILGKEIELAFLSPGDVFGEVSFLTGRPRTASVISVDKLEVLELNKVILEDVFERYPDVLKKMHDFYLCRVQDTVEKVKSKIKK